MTRTRKRPVFLTRAWTATIKFHGDPAGYRTLTTTIHGSNPTDAENAYLQAHPDVAAIIIRAEQR